MEKRQNNNFEENFPSESKDGIEQNENFGDCNKEFQATLNEEKEEIIPSNSTKVNDVNQKDEGNEKSKIPTKKIFLVEKIVKSTRKQRKNKETPKFSEKRKIKRHRGHNELFEIKKEGKKKNILSDCWSKAEKKIRYGIPSIFFWTPSSSNINRLPPYKKQKLIIRDYSVFGPSDDDEKIKKEDVYIIREICTNHDNNRFILLNGRSNYFQLTRSTDYTTG